ncbi:MAG: hypothetical protein M0T73_08500 [Deltaproteobacteria bacterium]|nr:hypothetical protein [Deltaproteobacteria bacterium]
MGISTPNGSFEHSYNEILNLLDHRGVLKERLPFSPGLLEEAVFFAYKMRFITQGDVKRYLNLTREGLRKKIYEWNSGDEGNCSCRMARNPLVEQGEE